MSADKGPSIDTLLKLAENHARQTLIGGKGEMVPICHLVRSDGQETVIGTPWRDNLEKEITLKMLAHLMREGGAIRYMVMCEAWMRKATETEAASFKPGDPLPTVPPIKDHPDRVEIVIACARDHGDKRVCVWETKRDEHGQCVDLVEITSKADGWESQWTELLPMDA